MTTTTKIAILGVGLIGGSLALCFKGKSGLHVIGYSPRTASAEKYVERGVVDEATTDLEEAVKDANYIFICSPVGMLEDTLFQLNALTLRRGCVITDVGSTKASVTACASKLNWNEVYFVGGHPMAGSERSGVEAASVLLFENAYYVLTPTNDCPESVIHELRQLLHHTRAHIIQMNAEEHDRVVGAISHLPHIVATALVNQVRQYNDSNELHLVLAAGGFRDITRIASSDPTVWRDILINNRQVMLDLLQDWQDKVEEWKDVLLREDGEWIEESFRLSGDFRNQMPERRKGAIHALYDVYMDIPDTPGVIGRIATQLGQEEINLSNLQIIESREDVPGVLRLSFREERNWERAQVCLRALGYEVYV
ncbi:prephenate dehydrogenase [Paenibacillus agilis]|uniref:Prephenate dehydrogenase n=1 Tax=Paenibacillus agilis TaxID=3020863 RepID=A0A559IZ55_9BACL|nr:prephenate dehydrogenase [Paenibacillus agilis]TVX92900.1 prephenate dehydrogenase [Paenibacillus agilis]